MKMKCVLFDMNGTIRNDLHVVYRSMSEVFREFGRIPPKLGEYRRISSVDYWKLYTSHGFVDSEKPAADALFRELFFHKYAPLAKPFPDAIQAVAGLVGKGVVVGVVSDLDREVLDMYMEQYGLKPLVSTSVCRDDSRKVKPSPDSILLAFTNLGMPPENGGYVGDQSWGVEAAHAARTTAIAISRRGSYHTRKMLEETNPDMIISELSDLLELV